MELIFHESLLRVLNRNAIYLSDIKIINCNAIYLSGLSSRCINYIIII